jgi:hypothetical protein
LRGALGAAASGASARPTAPASGDSFVFFIAIDTKYVDVPLRLGYIVPYVVAIATIKLSRTVSKKPGNAWFSRCMVRKLTSTHFSSIKHHIRSSS